MKRFVYLGAAVATLVIAVTAWLATAPEAAPESTFVLLDGSSKTTQNLKGKVTLVNFWATSCVTCVAEMPRMATTWEKYHAKGYDMLAVAMRYDPPAYVVNFAETRKLPSPSTTPAPWQRPGAMCN